MARTLAIRLTAALLFLLGAWAAYTQNQNKQPPQLTISKVKDDLYQIVGDGGNVAVLVTSEGVVLVDDKYEQDNAQINEKVKSVTSQPIKYIINTHYHADHSGGNVRFAPSATIVSTANSRLNILEKRPGHLGVMNMVPANVTFTEETSVFLGGKEVRAHYFGRGHTNGDAVVYFPQLRTIHTGDLMAGTSPLIDYPGGGSLAEWGSTLDKVLQIDFDTVIPGHGNVTDRAGLTTYRNNVEKLRARAQGLIRDGKSQDEVAKAMTAEFGWSATGLQMSWSVPGMMVELR